MFDDQWRGCELHVTGDHHDRTRQPEAFPPYIGTLIQIALHVLHVS